MKRLMQALCIICSAALASFPVFAETNDQANEELNPPDGIDITASMDYRTNIATVSGNARGADKKVVMTVLVPRTEPYTLSELNGENAGDIIRAVKQAKTDERGGFHFTFGIEDLQAGGEYQIKISCEGNSSDEISRTAQLYFAGRDERIAAIAAVNAAAPEAMEEALRHKALNLECDGALYQRNKAETNRLMAEIRDKNGGLTGDKVEVVSALFSTALIIAALSDDKFTIEELKAQGMRIGICGDTDFDSLASDILANMRKNKGDAADGADSLKKLYGESLALAAVNKADRSELTGVLEKYADELGIAEASYYKVYLDLGERQLEWNVGLAHQGFESISAFKTAFAKLASEPEDQGNTNSGGGKTHGGGGTGTGGGRAGGFAASLTDGEPATTDIKMSDRFTDMDAHEWAREAVAYLSDREILIGDGSGKFEPEKPVTRAEFTKMLVIALELYDEDAECHFSDCRLEDWYYKFVASASKAGIVNGMTEELFGADSRITREQIAAMLYRTGKVSGAPGDGREFADQNEISDYAEEAVRALQSAGIINGMENGKFEPQSDCTRAQAAVMLYRILTDQGGIK